MNVLRSLYTLPSHRAIALIALIAESENVSKDGNPWIVRKPIRSFPLGSAFRKAVADMVRDGWITRVGREIHVSKDRLVDVSTESRLVDRSTKAVDVSTSVVDISTSTVDVSTTCTNGRARVQRNRGTEEKRGSAASPASPPKRPAKKKPASNIHPNRKAVIAMFDSRYKAVSGGISPGWKGKEVKLANELAKSHDLDLIERRMDACFNKRVPDWVWRGGALATMGTFSAAFASIPVNGNGHAKVPSGWKITEDQEIPF